MVPRPSSKSARAPRGGTGASLEIRGARENNLRGIDLDIPLGSRTTIVGVSGSGKSSLAFDTIAREGLRRFLEATTWSEAGGAAARRLAELRRPRVERWNNLPAVLAVGQGDPILGPRTTFGALCGFAPGLRALVSLLGIAHCPRCGAERERRDAARQADELLRRRSGATVRILAELTPREEWERRVAELPVRGLTRVLAEVEGRAVELRADEPVEIPRGCTRLFAQVDKLALRHEARDRLVDAIERAVSEGGRYFVDDGSTREAFASARVCAACGEPLTEIGARLLTRASAAGRCEACQGEDAECSACGGSGYSKAARSVKLAGRSIADLEALEPAGLRAVIAELDTGEGRAAKEIAADLVSRLDCAVELGLGAVAAGRRASSLSSGELQRARCAAALGARVRGALFVLDEPTVGCHPADRGALLTRLDRVRDAGNTVLVVEHDAEVARTSDFLVELGPGAGAAGGRLVAAGTPRQVLDCEGSRFRAFLEPAPAAFGGQGPDARGPWLEVRGARGHNLRGIDVKFPVGRISVVCGVSGSGKSSLVFGTLAAEARRHLDGEGTPTEKPLPHDGVLGLDAFTRRVVVGPRLPRPNARSTPASYLGAAGELRELLASTPAARARGFDASHFSANRGGWRRRDGDEGLAGGRCEACAGRGFHELDLQLLETASVDCAVCQGTRFAASTLEVRWRGRHIAEWYDVSLEEAAAELDAVPKIAEALAPAIALGLGYLRFGERGDRLSGGEWKRLQLAKVLGRSVKSEHALVLLDEPTRGLHPLDVERLLTALSECRRRGHTVVVVEHSLDVLRAGDWAVELGPGAGLDGGRVVFEGPPKDLARASTPTGEALRAVPTALTAPPAHAAATGGGFLEVRGARARNLKGFDVKIPRDAWTCVSGPSGSGKSALVLDVVGAEGRRRFLSALSIAERRALEDLDTGRADAVEGVGATIVLAEPPKGSWGDATGLTRLLAELYASFAAPHCPECQVPMARREPSETADELLTSHEGAAARILAPVRTGDDPVRELRARGYARVWAGGAEKRLEDVKADEWAAALVVVDRVRLDRRERPRLLEALEEASLAGRGRGEAQLDDGPGAPRRIAFDRLGGCPSCGRILEASLTPADFLRTPLTGAAAAARWRGLTWPAPSGWDVARLHAEILARRAGIEGPEGALLDAIARRVDAAAPLLDPEQPLTLGADSPNARAAWMLCAAALAPAGATAALDDPTRGLSRARSRAVADALVRFAAEGKTILTATADPILLERCAFRVDLGPAAGAGGGALVHAGPSAVKGLTSDDGASFAPPARWSVHAVEAESLRPEELDALARKEHGARRDLVKVGFDDDDTSTPAEILGVLEPSAALFARVPQARELGFGAERFLFTEGGRAGGRCAACQGTGAVELDRELLPGELAPCPACDGRRYEPRTLSVKLYGRSIAEVLDLDLLTAARLFGDHPRIARPLRAAAELGVGHLRLGAPPRETSPSERARLRLAVKLDRDPERTAWIVARAADGLFGEDLTRVARALDRLVQSGGAVAAFGARLAEEIPRVLEWPAAKPRRSRLTQSGT